jgi:hypothetical protein
MPQRAPDGTIPAQPQAPHRTGLAEDYAALEAALSAFPRRRWFLAEYARRSRTAETDMLLEAIARLETAVLKPQRQEAAEEIQEVAWTLRERGTDVQLCDKIDQRATDIYTACSFQDITGQRTGKVVRALRFIEQRINAMIEIWGVDDIAFRIDAIAARMGAFAEAAGREDGHLLKGPQRKGDGLNDVDHVLNQREAKAPSPAGLEALRAGDGGTFERPEPLTVAELHAVKRAALFS